MNNGNGKSTDRFMSLRWRAEEVLLSREREKTDEPIDIDFSRVLHELDVYHKELELQNEELRETQEKLEEALEKYTDLFDYAPVGYITMDKNGVILNANLTFSEMLQKDRRLLVKKPFSIYVLPKYRDVFRRYLAAMSVESALQETAEVQLMKEDKSCFYAHLESTPLQLSSGGIQEINTVVQDVSRQVKLEEALNSSNRELLDFAYRLSHDLRSPMTIVHAYANELRDCPEKISEFLPIILSRLEYVEIYMDNLLQLSRAGKVIGAKELIQLKELIEYTVSISRLKGVPDEITTELDVKKIYGNFESLSTLFSNLLENSLIYRNPDKEKSSIYISSSIKNNHLFLSFKDNGKGVDEIHIDRIFQPGYTIDKNLGTGFGLAIAKKIVEAHNGTICARSHGKNQGTEFMMVFPVNDP